jgi:hypothetical protein
MNNEERFLLACLSPTNFTNYLNDLLEYCNNMYALVDKINRDKIFKYEDFFTHLVLKNAITNYYSSKIKLHIEHDEDLDEEESPKKEQV